MPEPLLLTATETAALLGVSEAVVYQMARNGILPVVRMGRRMRFDKARLKEWIAAGGQALPGGWRQNVAN